GERLRPSPVCLFASVAQTVPDESNGQHNTGMPGCCFNYSSDALAYLRRLLYSQVVASKARRANGVTILSPLIIMNAKLKGMLMRPRIKRIVLFIAGVTLCLSLLAVVSGHTATADARFEISYPASLDNGPITGRVFVTISKNNRVEPRLQAGSYNASVPFYGLDVQALKPGEIAVIDASPLGCPVESLSQLPAGEYSPHAPLNLFT